jgi:hypothetical protein
MLVSRVDLTRVVQRPELRARVFDELVERARSVPGVRTVASSLATPLSGGLSTRMVDEPRIGGRDADRIVAVNFVGPGWFAMYGTPLVRGRDINDQDRVGTEPIALVNEAFGRKFFGSRDPVGQRIIVPPPVTTGVPTGRAIVGVVGDAVYDSLRESARPTIYIPLTQWDFAIPFSGGSISVRSASGAADALTRTLSESLTKAAPDVTFDFRVLTQQIRWASTQERVLALLAAFFGIVALLLGGLGLYGVTTQAVVERRREIGIRLAIGGRPVHVISAMLVRLAGVVALGITAGLLFSVWIARLAASLLYGIRSNDPTSVVVAALVFSVAALLAAGMASAPAARIDPAEVLRER